MEQARDRFTVQIKNPDGIGWLDVAARDSWESAEKLAERRQFLTGQEHRVALIRDIAAPLSIAQLAEGDATQERA